MEQCTDAREGLDSGVTMGPRGPQLRVAQAKGAQKGPIFKP